MFAFVSGGTGALDFGTLLNVSAALTTTYAGALLPVLGADLLGYIHLLDDGQATDLLTLNVPLGLQFQPLERLALTLRTGYTMQYMRSTLAGQTSSSTTHFIPVSLELAIAIARQVDIVASFALQGPVASISDGGTTTTANGETYANDRLIGFGVRGHF